MRTRHFNKVYVIESLKSGDRKTGKELHDDLLRYEEMKYDMLTVEYKPITSRAEWDTLMDEIAEDCEQNGSQPILHLEIHGEKTGKGLVFSNKDFLSYDDMCPQLTRINIATHCNLFLTLAVCKGLFISAVNRLSKPMPFCGIMAAFDIIYEDDLAIRYNEFYDELFTSFELAKAYKRLLSANQCPSQCYRFIHADDLFCREYQRYIDDKCNPDVIKQRALESAQENNFVLSNRQQIRKFQRDFEEQEKKTRLHYYLEAANTFFMLDRFPENKERFPS